MQGIKTASLNYPHKLGKTQRQKVQTETQVLGATHEEKVLRDLHSRKRRRKLRGLRMRKKRKDVRGKFFLKKKQWN